MVFFTISTLPEQKSCKCLSKKVEKPQYTLKRNSEGVEYLVHSGSVNVFDEIQIFKDECNIYNIIRRYQLGDQSVLSKCNGQYIDTLGQPKTMQEALNLSIKLKDNFNSLKPEVRLEFGNDFNTFLKSVADGTVVNIISKFNTVPDEKEDNSHE